LLQAMRQWLGETPASSMQIELEEFRPMDRIPSTWNSAFLNGPIKAASLGCTDRLLTSDLLRRQTGLLGRRYSSANHGCSPSQISHRMDSVPNQVVRFMGVFRASPTHGVTAALSVFFSVDCRPFCIRREGVNRAPTIVRAKPQACLPPNRIVALATCFRASPEQARLEWFLSRLDSISSFPAGEESFCKREAGKGVAFS